MITMQRIRQLQWTDTMDTSENLKISFLKNRKGHQGLTKKKLFSYLRFLHGCKDFKVATSLLILSKTRPSSMQQQKQLKTINLTIVNT